MPLFKKYDSLYIVLKNKKISAKVIFETKKKLGLEIENNKDNNNDTELLRNESHIKGECTQGNYECYFQSNIEDFDYDILNNRYLMILDYPAYFRRILKVKDILADKEKS